MKETGFIKTNLFNADITKQWRLTNCLKFENILKYLVSRSKGKPLSKYYQPNGPSLARRARRSPRHIHTCTLDVSPNHPDVNSSIIQLAYQHLNRKCKHPTGEQISLSMHIDNVHSQTLLPPTCWANTVLGKLTRPNPNYLLNAKWTKKKKKS